MNKNLYIFALCLHPLTPLFQTLTKQGEGWRQKSKNAECAYAIACSTRKTKHAKKERRTKRKKNRPVSAKSRQETTKSPPLFSQSPHDFFNAYTLRTPRRTKPAQKGGAYSEKWGNATPSALTHRKKNQSSQQKQTPSSCLSRKMILLLRKSHRKTPYIARFSHTSRPTLHPLQLVPRIGSADLRELYL